MWRTSKKVISHSNRLKAISSFDHKVLPLVDAGHHVRCMNSQPSMSEPSMPKPPPPSKKSGVVWKLLGLTLVAGGGAVGYAWYDSQFRDLIQTNVPYSKEAFDLMFKQLPPSPNQQKSSNKSLKSIEGAPAPQGLAKPITVPTLKENKTAPVPTKEETPAEKKKREEEQKRKDMERQLEEKKAAEKAMNTAIERSLPLSLSEVESYSVTAIESESEAAKAINRHSEMLKIAMDNMDPTRDKESEWRDVTEAHETKTKILPEAETNSKILRSSIDGLRDSLNEAKANKITKNNPVIAQTEKTLNRIEYDFKRTEAKRIKAQSEARLMAEYRDLVKKGKEDFLKEVQSMKEPYVAISRTEDKLTEEEMNSLIAHAHRRIEQMQKRLAEQEALEQIRLDAALERQKEEDEKLKEDAVHLQYETCQKEFAVEKQMLETEAEIQHEINIRLQLKRQAAAHSEHLTDVLKVQEAELKQQYMMALKQAMISAKDDMRQEISQAITRLKGLEMAIDARAEAEQRGRKAQELWLACQSLQSTITAIGLSVYADPQPLAKEVEAIEAAGDSHPFVSAIVSSIPSTSLERGVYTEEQLADRFDKVRRVCRRVGLIDERGGTLYKYGVSFLQSIFILRASHIITDTSVEVSPDELDTFTILDNAAYFLKKGDLEQTVRFMNQLKGESRRVASDWIQEARLLLETRLAAEALLAHASAYGLGSLFWNEVEK